MTNENMTPAKKHIIFALISIIASLPVLFAVYAVTGQESGLPAPGQAAEHLKEIETPGKKWLNGYFGLFFRFKYLGNINWLIIPLIIYFFLSIKKPHRWQMAIILAWALTALFIISKGYSNYRYQFTLFPFTSAVILLLLWEILKNKKKYLQFSCFLIAGLVCTYNIYHYFDRYDFFWGLKTNEEKSRFPYQLLNYLNNDTALKESAKKVFVMDQPVFFYYTNQKGIDMQSPEAQWAINHLSRKSGSREAIFKEFKKILHVEYILLGANQIKLYQSQMLPEFLDCECRLILKDNGILLYRLREKPLSRELRSPRFETYQLWWPEAHPNKASPSLITFVETGKFSFDYTRENDRGRNLSCLTLHGLKPNEKGEFKINFGYEPGRGPQGDHTKLKMDLSRIRGRYLHFIARAAASPSVLNRDNFIFISEYNEKDKSWPSSRTYFSSTERRTYIVSRQIAADCPRVILGFRFTPQSPGEMLVIQDAGVYISDEPL
ncbi:MAG: hypothetical protein MUF15_14675 [Acidobacteria bacterium]|jgi:hypothetical protein|nr:hypothetical protein [Acidobacteriota bacterium]